MYDLTCMVCPATREVLQQNFLAVPVCQMSTLPSQAPLQKAVPLGLGATSSTASVCPLYTAKQVGGCTAPDEVACSAGAAHKRTVWSLPADKANAPCEVGRQLAALMPCLWACVLLISSPAPVDNDDSQQTIHELPLTARSVGRHYAMTRRGLFGCMFACAQLKLLEAMCGQTEAWLLVSGSNCGKGNSLSSVFCDSCNGVPE